MFCRAGGGAIVDGRNNPPERPGGIVAPVEREEEERQKQRFIEAETEIEEVDQPRGISNMYTPTKEEYNNRCSTHTHTLLPYRNLCPTCVDAKRASAGQNRAGARPERGVPVISIDYTYFNERGESDNRPVMVVHDSESQGAWAIAADIMGGEYVIRRLCDIITQLGYIKIVLKTFQEPSIAEVDRESRSAPTA